MPEDDPGTDAQSDPMPPPEVSAVGTCPQCRENDTRTPIDIAGVITRGTEALVKVVCPCCGWTSQYEL